MKQFFVVLIIAIVSYLPGFLLTRLMQKTTRNPEPNEHDSEPTSQEMAEWADRQW